MQIPEGYFKGKPRPGYSDEVVLQAVVDGLLPDVLQWGSYSETEAPEVGDELRKTMETCRDGYHMAKHLEDRYGWDPDSELVDILEGANFHGAVNNAVVAWLRDNGVKPAFEVGREVTVKLNGRNSGDHQGIISDIREDGTYLVRVPSLGHVETGLGVHGFNLNWEEVEAWNPQQERREG